MKLLISNKYSWIGWLILLLAIVYPPVFMHLANLVIRRFDEARLAVNAYEMSKNGNFIVTYFHGEPDMWNTKPPFMIWMQALFIKVFGYNELSVRLPAAFAAVSTCILLFSFCFRVLNKPLLGIIAAAILVTSSGYIGIHLSRTGDYDVLLTLFTTAYILCFFSACETDDPNRRNKFIAFFFLFLSFAMLTKSIAGLLFVPGLLIFCLLRKKTYSLIKNKNTYFYFLGFILIVSSYYLIREFVNPGYISAVIENELTQRYFEINEGHKGGPMFYFDFIVDTAFRHWFLFVFPGIAVSLASKDERLKNFALLLLITSISFILIISNSETKIYWYAMPVFPLLACSAALFFYWLVEVIKNAEKILLPATFNVVPYVMLFMVFWTPYNHILDDVYHPKDSGGEKEFYSMSYYLKGAVEGKRNISGSYIIHSNYHPETDMYIVQLEEENQVIGFKKMEEIAPNDIIATHREDVKSFIEERFSFEILEDIGEVKRYLIISYKE